MSRRSSLFEAVSEKIERAAREMSRSLDEAGIPHALIGGLAIGAYARPRTTKDVDFLVPSSARSALGGKPVIGHLSGVTVRVGGVNVDLMFPDEGEEFIEEALEAPPEIDGMPVLAPEAIVYLKMATNRRRDINDVIEMINAGLDVGDAREYLERHAEDMVDDFDQLVALAKEEGRR